MYHFSVQTLIGLGGTQRSRFESLLRPEAFFAHLHNRTRLNGPLSIFFGNEETFLPKLFLMSTNGPYFNFKKNSQQTVVSKAQRVSLLHFSALCDLPKTSKNENIFGKFISSFGYCRREYFIL